MINKFHLTRKGCKRQRKNKDEKNRWLFHGLIRFEVLQETKLNKKHGFDYIILSRCSAIVTIQPCQSIEKQIFATAFADFGE